jgi:kinesin family protein 2/24
MGLVSTWLNGIGLGYAFPAFRAAGIVTPAALAELDLAHYEALGISDPADRRKLFYLVQRIKMATDKPSYEQKEIDDIVSQSLSNGGDLYRDDDDDDDDDEEEEGDRKKDTVEEHSIAHLTSTSTLRPQAQKVKARETAATLRRTHESDENSHLATNNTSKSNVSTRTRNRALPVVPQRMRKNGDDEENESSYNEVSDWAEESDVVVADDEASLSSRRTSRRLQEKKMKSMESTSSVGSLEDAEETGDSSEQRDRTSRRGVGSSTRLGYSGDAETSKKRLSASRMRGSSTSDLDADDESSTTAAATRKSGVQAPRTRRYESSKLQNPATRTGKQLSTIPSDSVAPMSPLIKLSVSRLEADINHQQKVERKKKTDVVSSATKRLGRSLSQNDVTSSEDTDREPGKSRMRSTSLSGSDTDTHTNRRSEETVVNALSGSDSEVHVARRRSRLSTGCISSGSDTEGQSGRRRSRTSTGAIPVLKSRIVKPARKSSVELESVKSNPNKGAIYVHGSAEDTSWYGQVSRLRDGNQIDHELDHTISFGDDLSVDDDMRIRVVIRKRPMSTSECTSSKEVDVIHPLDYGDYGRILVYQAKTRVDLTRHIDTVAFAFDNVFDEASCNKDIYERTVRNLIPGVFDGGQWASVFAYGQTGSGKTFTMMGCNVTGIRAGTSKDDTDNYGLYFMAARDVFEMANMKEYRHMSIGVSLFEIYGGKLFDLLNNRTQVKCLEDHRGKVCFPGLSEHPVSDADDLMRIIENGACNRSTGTTSKNADSSRSHAILQISVRKTVGGKKNVEHGRLTFIDLAGSERGADTSKASRATRLEGAEINTSLLALKEVIRALATGDSLAHIPFRGSKLTQVLKESFVGENARSVMVACIAPNMSNCEHTLNTLRYADRVKERNAKTGALSASVSNNRMASSKRMSRQSSCRDTEKNVVRKDETGQSFEVDSDENDNFEDCQTGSFEEPVVDVDDDAEFEETFTSPSKMEYNVSSDSIVLDQLLGSNGDTPDSEPKEVMPSSSSRRHADQGEAANALITTHRRVMASMLAMCKDEMAIANKADADRDTIDSYLDQLEGLHERQCEMLTTLHEKLLEFHGTRGRPDHRPTNMLSDDDSFEDLRD